MIDKSKLIDLSLRPSQVVGRTPFEGFNSVRRDNERRLRLSSGIIHPWGTGGQPIMLDLQREQFEHDERFHREITRLSVHARLNHMALHFCKYTGQFATVCASSDAKLRERTIVNSFIISLCSANTLNFNLGECVAPNLGTSTVRDIGIYLADTFERSETKDDNWLLSVHAIQSGKMARACEKIDHLEEFPFRKELRDAILRLCQIALIAASIYGIDLHNAVHTRRQQIRNSFILALRPE